MRGLHGQLAHAGGNGTVVRVTHNLSRHAHLQTVRSPPFLHIPASKKRNSENLSACLPLLLGSNHRSMHSPEKR